MQADDAAVGLDGFDRAVDRRCSRSRDVGDQRRQHGGRAVGAVSFGDDVHRIRRRRVVEHAAAAAVHLRIDEAGRQNAAVERDVLGGIGGVVRRGYCLDTAVDRDEDAVLVEPLAVEDAGAAKDRIGHHIVSVTLRRLAGLSGSKPLRRVTDSMRR
jgi:hypothetical protein